MNRSKFWFLSTMIAGSLAIQPEVSAQLTISPEAEKSAVVDVICPDCVTADLFPSPYVEQTLPGIREALSYIGFDLKAILPQGSSISGAVLDVFDLNTEVDDQFVNVVLLDVSSDWDPETLDFNLAKSTYGATSEESPSATVGVDPAKVLCRGSAAMHLEFQPGRATTGSRAIFESQLPSADSELVAALNAALSDGDGYVTFVLYGETLDDNNMVGIDYGDGEPGPTLTLQIESGATSGETVVFDFDGNDSAAWTSAQSSAKENGPTDLGIISTEDPTVGNSVPPSPLTGTGFIGPVPFEAEDGTNTRDNAHETLVYRSPEFEITPNGEISFALIGGAKPGFDLDAINQDGLPAESDGNGSIGVALRNATTGQYLTFNARLENGGQAWETIILDEEILGDVIELGESYTLDFIDYHSGGWGWAGLDNVIIKQGTPITNYDFDDETLQGWTIVHDSSVENGPTQLGVISENEPAVGNSVPPTPLNSPAFIGPVPFEAEDGTNTRDNAHSTLVVRSPEFKIYQDGLISFALIGGSKPGFDIDEINASGLPESSDGNGSIGVALRKASTGEYLNFYTRAENGGQAWETIILGENELRGMIEFDESYTLDFIDYHSGGWGWAGLDDVTIQEGTPVIRYDFDDETLQGWTVVGDSSVENGPTQLGVISENDPNVGDSVPPTPLNTPAFIGPVPFEAENGSNTRDSSHSTLVLRSPEFPLHTDSEISFALIGGAKPGFDIDEVNANGRPTESAGDGSIGVALRKASTGEYLTFNTRSENGGQAWETIILNGDDFGDMIEEGEQYTLDFIDYHSGGWGWAGMDDVIIRPGTPAPPQAVGITDVSIQDRSIVIEYSGQLEASQSVTGEWAPVNGATSPYSEAITEDSKYFRIIE